MITYKQITKSSDIASLSDYYVLDVRTTGPNPSLNAISSVSMLQIEDDLVIQEAVVRIASESDSGVSSESGYYQPEQVADSIARILTGQTVVAEPTALQFLRALLERFGHEGEIRFVPVIGFAVVGAEHQNDDVRREAEAFLIQLFVHIRQIAVFAGGAGGIAKIVHTVVVTQHPAQHGGIVVAPPATDVAAAGDGIADTGHADLVVVRLPERMKKAEQPEVVAQKDKQRCQRREPRDKSFHCLHLPLRPGILPLLY